MIMNNPPKIIWYHTCHGRLGIFNSVEELIRAMKKQPYPLPNANKMLEKLQTNSQYHYAIGLLNVKMISAGTDIEKLDI